jgi:hypothetical protein
LPQLAHNLGDLRPQYFSSLPGYFLSLFLIEDEKAGNWVFRLMALESMLSLSGLVRGRGTWGRRVWMLTRRGVLRQ